MRASEPGESAIRLPWLSPDGLALTALARSASSSVWPTIRHDPGTVLLLLRSLPSASPPTFPGSLFQSSEVLEAAQGFLRAGLPAFVDWSRPEIAPIYQAAAAFASLAQRLAERVGGADPACAWAGGLLAPLGWMAVCAVDPEAAADCLRESAYAEHLPEIQRLVWRLDAQAIGRRLARRWQLPPWLRAIVGGLSVPAEMADAVEADGRLFRIVQLAVLLGQSNGFPLGLTVGTDLALLSDSLGLSDAAVLAILEPWREQAAAPKTPRFWTDPHALTLLPEVLALAIEKRRLEEGPFSEQLELEIDRLQHELTAQRGQEAERLQRQKLRALAELAAGAGHEINNPLAVISGQSQYLLLRESDPNRQNSLRTIVRQAERIHLILSELMQFARPPQPRRQTFDLRALVDTVLEALRPAAEAKPVALECTTAPAHATVHADSSMVQTALLAVVRNAVEAAFPEGWVRLAIQETDTDWQVVIEDSGPGPQPVQREHLFDPFWSGRHAGRGRGLGLPTAWRLAQENGGDVRFEPAKDHPSRFVLTLPKAAKTSGAIYPIAEDHAERKSA